MDEPNLEKLVNEALSRLNEPSNLADCSLAEYLPRTLRVERKQTGKPARGSATPLELAHDLRAVLINAIDRLKADDSEGSPQARQYQILWDEYVLGMPTRQVMARHNRSESNLHLHRRAGIRALAAELRAQEARLSRNDDRTALDYLG